MRTLDERLLRERLLGSSVVFGDWDFITSGSGVWDWAAAGSPTHVQLWVVAGGASGGGGSINAGGPGGGAGGVVPNTSTPLTLAVSGDVSYAVGDGGVFSSNGIVGNDSWFGAATAVGGGAWNSANAFRPESEGGSGGGQFAGNSSYFEGGPGRPGQGNDGGVAFHSDSANNRRGGGGGGATSNGGGASSGVTGDDGQGLDLSGILGVGVGDNGWFGGGGGGGCQNGSAGAGGNGGGGDGGVNGAGTSALANTGGGGGGAWSTNDGGDGGSGIIIWRPVWGDLST